MNNINIDRLTVLNKRNTPSYGDPQEVLEELLEKYDSRTIREFVSDEMATPNFSRPLPPKEILFPAVYLRKLENVYVYDAFLTFDNTRSTSLKYI